MFSQCVQRVELCRNSLRAFVGEIGPVPLIPVVPIGMIYGDVPARKQSLHPCSGIHDRLLIPEGSHELTLVGPDDLAGTSKSARPKPHGAARRWSIGERQPRGPVLRPVQTQALRPIRSLAID